MSVATSTARSESKPANHTGPYLPHEVDFSKLNYSDVKQMGNGPAKMCYLDYGGNKLVLETPWMLTYDGIRQPPIEFRDEKAPPKYSVEFSLKGYKGEDNDVKAFYELLENFQNKLLDDSCNTKYAYAWHKKKEMSRAVAEALYSPTLKFSRDKETGEINEQYPPKLKVKVPCWEGEWQCEVYNHTDQNKVEGDLSKIVTGRMEARAIIQCTGLWFAAGKFGASWKLLMLEYKSLEQGIKPYAFRNNPLNEMMTISDNEKMDTSASELKIQAEDEDEDIVDSEDD